MTPLSQNPRAFVLGAGLGTRLRPLTDHLPKPLVPIHGQPLVTHALQHLKDLGVTQVIINTHHAADCWVKAFPQKEYQEIDLQFRHEPVLLDTGGGLKNVEDFLKAHGTFIIYNGDIATSLPLQKAWDHHQYHHNLATLVLRSQGGPLHISLNDESQIVDIRGKLGSKLPGKYLFTGIHIVEPEIFSQIPNAQPRSIIEIYLDLIRKEKRIGGVVLDEGDWSDVGTLDEYHRMNS